MHLAQTAELIRHIFQYLSHVWNRKSDHKPQTKNWTQHEIYIDFISLGGEKLDIIAVIYLFS